MISSLSFPLMQRLIDLRMIMLMLAQNILRYLELASGREDAIHNLVAPHFPIQGN